MCAKGGIGMSLNTLKTLRKKERDARRHLILEAARALFAERDFKHVTVREIAKKAGMAVGTIYNYYASLDELFLEIFLDSTDAVIHQISRQAEAETFTLEAACRFYIDFLNNNLTFYQIMSHFMLGGDLSEASTRKLNDAMRVLMDHLESVVVRKTGMAGNTRIVTHALFAALNGIMISYARYPGRTDAEIHAHARRLADIIAAVFANAKDVRLMSV
ncbi:MAG: TetR/AcrR family transcriptional regulator [Thermodesulfobacteriota bacterium]|nr:TetR/AcrR family transcriptional regulator [Thermodesulfobacteriota bacterium]